MLRKGSINSYCPYEKVVPVVQSDIFLAAMLWHLDAIIYDVYTQINNKNHKRDRKTSEPLTLAKPEVKPIARTDMLMVASPHNSVSNNNHQLFSATLHPIDR